LAVPAAVGDAAVETSFEGSFVAAAISLNAGPVAPSLVSGSGRDVPAAVGASMD